MENSSASRRQGSSGEGYRAGGGLLFAVFPTLYFIPAAFYVSRKNK